MDRWWQVKRYHRALNSAETSRPVLLRFCIAGLVSHCEAPTDTEMYWNIEGGGSLVDLVYYGAEGAQKEKQQQPHVQDIIINLRIVFNVTTYKKQLQSVKT